MSISVLQKFRNSADWFCFNRTWPLCRRSRVIVSFVFSQADFFSVFDSLVVVPTYKVVHAQLAVSLSLQLSLRLSNLVSHTVNTHTHAYTRSSTDLTKKFCVLGGALRDTHTQCTKKWWGCVYVESFYSNKTQFFSFFVIIKVMTNMATHVHTNCCISHSLLSLFWHGIRTIHHLPYYCKLTQLQRHTNIQKNGLSRK